MQEKEVRKNRVKVNIVGNEYTILSENDESYVVSIADEVNKKVSLAQASNPSISSSMATTLVCLDYCDELRNEKKASQNLRVKLNEYIKENTKLKEELSRTKEKLEKFGKATFQEKNENIKKKSNTNINAKKKTKVRSLNTVISDDDEVSSDMSQEEYLKFFEKNNL